MKTIDEMLEYALDIADTNENCSIGFFVDNIQISRNLTLFNDRSGEYRCQTRLYKSLLGSRLQISNKENISSNFAGACFSHIFVYGEMDFKDRCILKSRWRSPYKFIEPMGIYSEYGVERWSQY